VSHNKAPHSQWVWALPALDFLRTPQQADGRQPRHPRHAVFATVNLVMSALFAGLSAELYHRRLGSLHNVCGPGPAACAWQLFSGVARSLAVQSVLEYYWHAAMHLPYLYAKLHRHHHTYKSPQVFDDLMIHPLEAFGYYLLLFSPSLVVNQHYAGMLIYMSLCGLFGVLDHSGIALRLGPFYDTRAHDVHHRCGFGPAVYKNLAFPFTAMDVLHRTFVEPGDAGYDEQAPRPSQLLNRTGSDDGHRAEWARRRSARLGTRPRS
jgi:sterol desaturase/sphingolipid hydroxylase (fatty acid hydroxylase superfamily)